MYLFEFDFTLDNTKLIVLANQLKDDLQNNEIDPDNFTLEELQDYFQKYDIILDSEDLYKLIQVPPLKSVISNIQGNHVAFVGHDDSTEHQNTPKDDTKNTVKQMAKSALNKSK